MAKRNCIFITLLTFPFEFLKSPLYLLFIYYLFSLRLTEFVSCMCDFARFFFALSLESSLGFYFLSFLFWEVGS